MSSAQVPAGPGTSGAAYLLDSSVLIPSLRGDQAMSTRIDSLPQVYVASIVLWELYYGAFGPPTRPDAALLDIQAVEQKATVLAADATTALIYGRIGQELKRNGFTMPDNDLWIAATAIQYDLMLAARDLHFNWIVGLRVEVISEDDDRATKSHPLGRVAVRLRGVMRAVAMWSRGARWTSGWRSGVARDRGCWRRWTRRRRRGTLNWS